MGIRDAARGAGRQAVSGLAAAKRATLGSGTEDGWVRKALDAQPRPGLPVAEPWELSFGTIVASHPRVPGAAAKLLGGLDGFGKIAIGPDSVGFDDADVSWDKVVEVRVHSAADLLPDAMIDYEVDRIRGLFPPIPGRKRLVAMAAEGLLTLVLAASEQADRQDRLLPCEIVVKGALGRTKTLTGGLFAAAVMTNLPEVGEGLVATAAAHGIPVTQAASPHAGAKTERGKALRARSASLAAKLAAVRGSLDEPADGDDSDDIGDAALPGPRGEAADPPGGPAESGDKGL
ncbi:hypothetical protein ACPA54_18850 [Uniformispora flossi]|uniref:hypothetical protein n=1 Tax=Uniformispora flossi TaxID=3390723 RepID=UPI003C2E792F